MLTSLLLFLFFLTLSAFFSSSETAFISLNRLKLKAMSSRKEGVKATRILNLLDHIEELLSTILIGNTLVNIAAASTATYLFAEILLPHNKEKAVILSTVFTTVFILFFAEMLPKTLAANFPESLSFKYYHPIQFFIYLFKPVSFLSSLMLKGILKIIKPKEAPSLSEQAREEARTLILMSVGKLEKEEGLLVKGVIQLKKKKVREVMIPRANLVAIKANSSLKEILKIIKKYGFSRYPVYEGRLDNILGILFVKDIIPFIEKKGFQLQKFLRPPFFVPIYASLLPVLQEMQRRRVHMAIVVDEHSSVRGIVTLEDIIEEVVGDIQDEHEKGEIPKVKKLSEREFLIPAYLPVEEIREETGADIPIEEEYSTLAGFILKLLGRIPEEGEKVEYENLTFEILKKRRNAILLVKLTKKEGKNESGSD